MAVELKATCILTQEEFDASFEGFIEGKTVIGYDLETEGFDPTQKRIVGFSYSFKPGTGYYVPVAHLIGQNAMFSNPLDQIVEKLKKSKTVLAYNSRFEMRFLEHAGYNVEDDLNFFDVAVLTFLKDSNNTGDRSTLKYSSLKYLGIKQPTYEETVGKVSHFGFTDPQVSYYYAAMDAITTLLLAQRLGREIMAECNFVAKLDNKILYPLMKMEDSVVNLDTDTLTTLYDELSIQLDESLNTCWSIAGTNFNPSSQQQVSSILGSFGLSTGKPTKSGHMPTGKPFLEKLSHPLPKEIVRYRSLRKLRDSYVVSLRDSAKEGTPRFQYDSTGVPTGRFAARGGGKGDKRNSYFTNVNVQSIPKADSFEWNVVKSDAPGAIFGHNFTLDDVASRVGIIEGFNPLANVRRAFLAPDEYVFFHLDYSGQELRIAAVMSGERVWLDTILNGGDIHKATAFAVWGEENYNRDLRKCAKFVNFGALFGGTEYTLQKQMGCSLEDAKEYRRQWRLSLPILVGWFDYMHRVGRKNGTVYTFFGRPRRVMEYFLSGKRKDVEFGKRTCVNTVVQGCLQSHVRILTDRGYLPIGDLYTQDVSDTKVWTGTKWARFRVLNRGRARLAKIRTFGGNQLDCDDRHEIFVHTMRGHSMYRNVNDLIKRKRICTIKPVELEFGHTKFNLDVENKRAPHNFVTIDVDSIDQEELFYWIGRHIGDGWLSKKGHWKICFGRHEESHARKFESFLRRIGLNPSFEFTINDVGGKSIVVIAWSMHLCRILLKLGVKHQTARTKRVPTVVWEASLSLRRSFLGGLIDADGYKKGQSLHMMNHELLREVQLLLEVSFEQKTRLNGPFKSCGSSNLRYNVLSIGCRRLDQRYSYAAFKELELSDRYEDTFTLEVFDDEHRYVSDGFITKNCAADLMKIFILKWYKEVYKKYKGTIKRVVNDVVEVDDAVKFVDMIHDEFNLYIHRSVLKEAIPEIMELATFTHPDWEIPMACDFELGTSWGRCFPHKFDENGNIVPVLLS